MNKKVYAIHLSDVNITATDITDWYYSRYEEDDRYDLEDVAEYLEQDVVEVVKEDEYGWLLIIAATIAAMLSGNDNPSQTLKNDCLWKLMKAIIDADY